MGAAVLRARKICARLIATPIAVWGGEAAVKAVRALAPVGAKFIEWERKLGLCYIGEFARTCGAYCGYKAAPVNPFLSIPMMIAN